MKKIRLFFLSLLSMIAWTGVLAQTADEYQAALDAIVNNGVYYVKSNVDGTYYYLKGDGTLTDTKADATTFIFQKIAGPYYQYGFKLNNDGKFFSNPSSSGNIDDTKLNTSTRGSESWEAQVFFLKDGKYAVRACNVEDTGGWSHVGSSFWTWKVEDVDPTAGYQWDPDYIWELELDEFVMRQVAAYDAMHNWPYTVQAAKGLVKEGSKLSSNAPDPSEGKHIEYLLDNDYTSFFHSSYHGGEDDPGEYHYLQAELSESVDKIQFYYKKRSQNNNNRPTDIVISVSNDGENFEDVDELTQDDNGLPTDASMIDYLSETIDLGAKYKYVRFTIVATNNGDKNGEYVFFTFSEFYVFPVIAEAQDAFDYMESKSGVAAKKLTEAQMDEIEALDASLKNALATVTVTYELYEEDGTTKVSTKDVVQESGSEIAIPTSFINDKLYDYETVGTIGDQNCTIKVIRTLKEKFAYPFERLSNERLTTLSATAVQC